MRGKKHQAVREAENGAAVLWFWQATGEHWGHATNSRPSFDSVAFNTASKASHRLAANQGERSTQTNKRAERLRQNAGQLACDDMRVAEAGEDAVMGDTTGLN